MHSLGTLGEDISRLLKTSGDSGDTGDKSKMCLRHNGLGVASSAPNPSPLGDHVATACSMTGDAKIFINQAPAVMSPLSPVSPLDYERGAIAVRQAKNPMLSAHVPDEWREGYRLLRDAAPLDAFRPDHWQSMVEDGAAFLGRWGDQAAALGWRDVDVFGVHAHAPAARVGYLGLAFFIKGGKVVALTNTTATIRRRSNAFLTWLRPGLADAVPVWDLLR